MASIMEGYELYQAIRDDRRNQQDQEQAKIDLAQFAKDPTFEPDYSKYSDPTRAEKMGTYLKGQRDSQFQQSAGPVLQDFARGYQSATGSGDFTDPASMQVLAQEGVRVPSLQDMRNPYVRGGVDSIGQTGQLQADLADSYAGTATPQALARIATNPMAQKQHNVISTQQTAQDKADQRAVTDAATRRNSGFQDAIAGLSGPSTSPFDLGKFARRGGYDTASGVESDIRQAASDYNAPAAAVNNELDNVRQLYKETYLPEETVKVGRTTATGQRNLLGDFRKDVQSTAPVIKINTGDGSGGGVKDSDFRAWLKDGKSSTLSVMRFNRPDQLSLIAAMVKNPDKADIFAGQLEKSMTPEQRAEYDTSIEAYIKRYAPDSVVSEYGRRVKRVKPEKAAASAPIYATNPTTGQRISSRDGGKSWQPR